MRASSRPGPGLAVATFFAFKIVLGAILLIASARWMTVGSFAVFSQLLILVAYLTSIGTAGVQNGLIRQIAAADGNAGVIARELRAALSIWGCFALLALISCWVLKTRIAILLTGSPDIANIIPPLALLAMACGLGQLLCSVLTGTDRAGPALLSQGIGMIAGTLPALYLLHRGSPAAAALAFTAGQSGTALIAAIRIRAILQRAWRSTERIYPEIRGLLRFSGAFLATASIMPLTLIGLRSVYSTAFGLDALGYWLAANRISDVNTQLLGLYMVQAFLPAMAGAPRALQNRLARRTLIGGLGVMAIPLVIFLAAPSLLIHVLLSAKFMPGSLFFLAYFTGDMLRVGASIASYTALARGKLKLYVGLEAASASMTAIIVMILTRAGVFAAPAIAYVACYAVILAVAGAFILRDGRV